MQLGKLCKWVEEIRRYALGGIDNNKGGNDNTFETSSLPYKDFDSSVIWSPVVVFSAAEMEDGELQSLFSPLTNRIICLVIDPLHFYSKPLFFNLDQADIRCNFLSMRIN
jgi:hypothetical protein